MNWLTKLRRYVGLKLLYSEGKNVKQALWEYMNCGLHHRSDIMPSDIELSIETGHNQTVRINNGCRSIVINLMHDQIGFEAFGKLMNDEGQIEFVRFEIGGHGMIPSCPDEMRVLVNARKLKGNIS